MLSTEGFSREVLWRIQQPAIVIFCRQQVDLVEGHGEQITKSR
jgi:hypothetical protein